MQLVVNVLNCLDNARMFGFEESIRFRQSFGRYLRARRYRPSSPQHLRPRIRTGLIVILEPSTVILEDPHEVSRPPPSGLEYMGATIGDAKSMEDGKGEESSHFESTQVLFLLEWREQWG